SISRRIDVLAPTRVLTSPRCGPQACRCGGSEPEPRAIAMKNAFTVDVEDYFQVEGFANAIDRSSWEGFRTRVGASTSILLEMLARHNARATFFVLGWVARKHPEIVRQIVASGHEVASHGMSHRLIYTQTPAEFQRETHDAKALLEDQ